MTWPSAAVIVSSGPIGAAPWETQGSTSTPSSRTPTAPSSSTSSPRNSARAAVDRRARWPGRRAAARPARGRPRKRSTRVGREASAGRRAGSRRRRRRGRAARSARRRPRRAPRRLGVERARASPPSSVRRPDRDRRCRPRPRGRRRARRPRRSRRAAAGASASCDAPRASPRAPRGGARRRRRRRRRRRGRRARRGPRPPPRPRPAAGPGPWRARVPMRTAMPVDDTPRRARDSGAVRRSAPAATGRPRALRPDRRGQDRRRASRSPTACAPTGERPVAVSADALQVYAGLEILTGVADAARAARGSSTGWSAFLPVDATFSAGAYAGSRTPRSTALLAAGRDGRSSSAAPASTCAPRSPSSTCARRRPTSSARAWRTEVAAQGPPALHAALRPARALGGRAASRRPTRSRVVRALELLEPGELEPPDGGRNAVDDRHPPPDAARRPDDGPRRRSTRASTRASTRWSPPGAVEEVRAAHAAGASPTARAALGFEELLAGDVAAMKRRTRRYAKRQLTWLRKLPGVDARRRHRPRARGRAPPRCSALAGTP